MWKLELEEQYFRVYDSKKQIAGYFDPNYGDIYPRENEEEIIQKMLKDHEKIPGGLLMLPMLKFGIFDPEYQADISRLEDQLNAANKRIQMWKNFMALTGNNSHSIRLSHTDNDMLSITFPVKFSKPTPLDKKMLLEELTPILDQLQTQGLL